MKLILIIFSILLITLTGCTPYIREPTPNIHGIYDDISYLECKGNVLERVSACQLQKLREGLGEDVKMTQECQHILTLFQNNIYNIMCYGKQGTKAIGYND